MIAGYHLVWTAYGWWLPNDPRGSTSREGRCASIAGLGELHYGRRKKQPAGRVVREFYEAARSQLRHALLTFSDPETATIGDAFGDVVRRRSYTCYACAVMRDHVHVLIRKREIQTHEACKRETRRRLDGDFGGDRDGIRRRNRVGDEGPPRAGQHSRAQSDGLARAGGD